VLLLARTADAAAAVSAAFQNNTSLHVDRITAPYWGGGEGQAGPPPPHPLGVTQLDVNDPLLEEAGGGRGGVQKTYW
jgi:hypothetical protein